MSVELYGESPDQEATIDIWLASMQASILVRSTSRCVISEVVSEIVPLIHKRHGVSSFEITISPSK